MPPVRGKRTRRSRSKRVPRAVPRPISRAPFQGRADALEERVMTTRVILTNFTNFTSSVAGAIATVVPLFDPSAGQDWASFVALYREFRAVGCQLSYWPDNQYSKVTTTCRPIIGVVDINDNGTGALTGYGQAATYESKRFLSLENHWVMTYRMDSADPRINTWLDTNGFAALDGAFKYFASGLTVSTEYGMCVVTWIVQFRGRA